MPVAQCGDVAVHYEESGAGVPIVWVPGTGLLGTTWRQQTAHFESRHRCITLDLRGSGQTVGGGASFTVAEMAEDVAGLLDVLNISSAHLVGLSLGSAVVQELALHRSDLVRSATLVGTWSSSRLYALERGPLEVFAQFAFWMSAHSIVDEEPKLQRAVEESLAQDTSRALEGTAGHFRADLGHETRDRLGGIGCPTLVLHGEEDLITLPRYNRTVMASVPGAVLRSIPRAGHLVWLERPDEVNAVIEEFLVTAGETLRRTDGEAVAR
jgi:3-oxoadipate enol-lactonase